jgi:SagB-type dehydrogenase family enzyme
VAQRNGEEKNMKSIEESRSFLKDSIRKMIDFRTTDQHRGVPVPPMEEKVGENALVIALPEITEVLPALERVDLAAAIGERRSVRQFLKSPLNLTELSWLLWATQGVRDPSGAHPYHRTVPSAGARHSFNSYLFFNQVQGLPQGLYRYQPLSHNLVYLRAIPDQERALTGAVLGQRFVATAPVTFVWTTVPYRMEWRYSLAAHRVILLDAGHVGQNLYLGCAAVRCGTCAVAAYDQERLDKLLGVDGNKEFAIYLAPVGKVANAPPS